MADQIPVRHESDVLLPPVHDEFCDFIRLPRRCSDWELSARHSGVGTTSGLRDVQRSLKSAEKHGRWQWPEQPVVFVSDPHADADGFLQSLVAAGVIRRHGRTPNDFSLTPFGRKTCIVVGGDCLDKGPSNLDLLDALGALFASGADVQVLAGNHDLRFMLAIEALTGGSNPLTDHLFLRMGRKSLPLLREVWERFPALRSQSMQLGEKAARDRIFPDEDWFETFPLQARKFLAPAALEKELKRLRSKRDQFDGQAAAEGMSMRMMYAAALMSKEIFLKPHGVYSWYFRSLNMVQRNGSILFVHAGLDDDMCALLNQRGVSAINNRFHREIREAPFDFYFGPVANLVRTKYRQTDKKLTEKGVQLLHARGVKLIVQGHVNNHSGQRLIVKQGLLHLEGDVTLDRASRKLEGLSGIGAGATLIHPSGDIIGLSSDFPAAKHFRPEAVTQGYQFA